VLQIPNRLKAAKVMIISNSLPCPYCLYVFSSVLRYLHWFHNFEIFDLLGNWILTLNDSLKIWKMFNV
jgi:hypothetical protein